MSDTLALNEESIAALSDFTESMRSFTEMVDVFDRLTSKQRACWYRLNENAEWKPGIFHLFGSKTVGGGKGGPIRRVNTAMVEDVATGRVYEIHPNSISFKPLEENSPGDEISRSQAERLGELDPEEVSNL